MIKPYPGIIRELSEQIYNYRLSRARRVIQNAFGILATRFRIYRRPIIANVDLVKNVVKATIALQFPINVPTRTGCMHLLSSQLC